MCEENLTNVEQQENIFSWETEPDNKYPFRTVLRRFGKKAIEMFHLNQQQIKILNITSQCKTGELGYNVAYCSECNKYYVHACSCNNRECPNCQSVIEEAWIEERSQEALPGISYFHIVMTLPKPVVELFRYNKELLYPLLASAASRTVVKQAQGLPHNGFTPSVITVTHPGGSRLNFRPHVHMIVSGGGLTKLGQFRKTRKKGFFLSLDQMAAGFRGRFLSRLKELYQDGKLFLPESLVDPAVPSAFQSFVDSLFHVKWLPFIKETFVGKDTGAHGKSKGNAIRYLARYLFRTGISNRRITEVSETGVTFLYKDYTQNGLMVPTTMDGPEFVGAFLDLIMPARCPKVRYFGIMANCAKKRCLALAFRLLSAEFLPVKLHGSGVSTHDTVLLLRGLDIDLCPCCKSKMVRLSHILASTHQLPREHLQKQIQTLFFDVAPAL